MTPACFDCRFFDDQTSREGDPHGFCRRFAPRPFFPTPGQDLNLRDQMATWPDVGPDDWCGEFEAAPAKP